MLPLTLLSIIKTMHCVLNMRLLFLTRKTKRNIKPGSNLLNQHGQITGVIIIKNIPISPKENILFMCVLKTFTGMLVKKLLIVLLFSHHGSEAGGCTHFMPWLFCLFFGLSLNGV